MTVETELLSLTRAKGANKSRQELLKEVLLATSDESVISEDQYKDISPEADAWIRAAGTAFEDNEPLPEFAEFDPVIEEAEEAAPDTVDQDQDAEIPEESTPEIEDEEEQLEDQEPEEEPETDDDVESEDEMLQARTEAPRRGRPPKIAAAEPRRPGRPPKIAPKATAKAAAKPARMPVRGPGRPRAAAAPVVEAPRRGRPPRAATVVETPRRGRPPAAPVKATRAPKAAAAPEPKATRAPRAAAAETAPRRRAIADGGASAGTARTEIKRLMLQKRNITNEDIYDHLKKKGIKMSPITVRATRSEFQNSIKVLDEFGHLKGLKS